MGAHVKEQIGLFLLHLLEDDPEILSLCSVPEIASIYSQEMGCELNAKSRRQFIRAICSILCDLLNCQELYSADRFRRQRHAVKLPNNSDPPIVNHLTPNEVSLPNRCKRSTHASKAGCAADSAQTSYNKTSGEEHTPSLSFSHSLELSDAGSQDSFVPTVSGSQFTKSNFPDVNNLTNSSVILFSPPTITAQDSVIQPGDSPPYITVRRNLSKAVISVRPAQSQLVEET